MSARTRPRPSPACSKACEEVAFFSRVTQPREFHARSLRTQQAQESADAGRASERDDGDTGFHVCVTGPEAELIRALGANAVQEVIDALGDLRAFRILQKQPAQRERSVEQQLRRFMGTISGRKSHYARSLVDDLDLAHVPRPLNRLPAHPYR